MITARPAHRPSKKKKKEKKKPNMQVKGNS